MAIRRDGGIEQRGSGKWRVRVFLGRDHRGRRLYRSKVIEGSKRDAQEELKKLQEDRDEGRLDAAVTYAARPLNQFLDYWLDEIVAMEVADSTRNLYRSLLNKHVRPALGSIRLDRIRPAHVQRMFTDLSKRAERDLAPRTYQLVYRAMRKAMRKAVGLRILRTNPCAEVSLPRKRAVRPHRALSRAELQRLLAAADGTPFEALWHLLAVTGMRPQEALALTWDRIDFEASTLRIDQAITEDAEGNPVLGVPKTERSRRTVPVPAEVLRRLKAHRAAQAEHALRRGQDYDREAALVFAGRDGQALCDHNLRNREWTKLRKAAGIENASPYSLRHTAATELVEAGVNPTAAAALLGHSVEMLLTVYAKEPEGGKAKAVGALAELLYAAK
jgi:integrase